nr:hypothetical protein [Rhodospirillales bacterium]
PIYKRNHKLTDNPDAPKSALDMTPAEYKAARRQIQLDHFRQQHERSTAATLARLTKKWGAPAPKGNTDA